MSEITNFPAQEGILIGERVKDACCPVCGDKRMFFLWIDSRRPMYCPEDPAWSSGGPRTITNVEQCPINSEVAKAKRRAAFQWLRTAPQNGGDND